MRFDRYNGFYVSFSSSNSSVVKLDATVFPMVRVANLSLNPAETFCNTWNMGGGRIYCTGFTTSTPIVGQILTIRTSDLTITSRTPMNSAFGEFVTPTAVPVADDSSVFATFGNLNGQGDWLIKFDVSTGAPVRVANVSLGLGCRFVDSGTTEADSAVLFLLCQNFDVFDSNITILSVRKSDLAVTATGSFAPAGGFYRELIQSRDFLWTSNTAGVSLFFQKIDKRTLAPVGGINITSSTGPAFYIGVDITRNLLFAASISGISEIFVFDISGGTLAMPILQRTPMLFTSRGQGALPTPTVYTGAQGCYFFAGSGTLNVMTAAPAGVAQLALPTVTEPVGAAAANAASEIAADATSTRRAATAVGVLVGVFLVVIVAYAVYVAVMRYFASRALSEGTKAAAATTTTTTV
jgi:hypothetical protein